MAFVALVAVAFVAGGVLLSSSGTRQSVVAQGVGRASWTPSESTTEPIPSRFLVEDDSITYATDAVWSSNQAKGLQGYIEDGLRYTHEVNDRGGRLSATGYWATNHPDPAFDRDDDDGDGRWEEAEITAGITPPVPGATYTSLVQFSRWHGKRKFGSCDWAWDRRLARAEVLSQLSRNLLGEWQAERYTLTYDTVAYPRVGAKPPIPADVPAATCRERRAQPDQNGFVVTFAAPLSWSEFDQLTEAGRGRWTAYEAIGSNEQDQLTWTCGGPVHETLALEPCRAMGVEPLGVTAAVGYFDDRLADTIRADSRVARVDGLRDALTELLLDVGGFGVVPPDLTVNDSYWELFLSD